MTITNAAASVAILAHCEAGTIVQRKWQGRDAEGRAVACLLGAIDPSVRAPADCSAELMPLWLAELTPVLFDELPAEEATPIARRYGALVARWDQLSPRQWKLVQTALLCHMIDAAVEAARPCGGRALYWPAVASACEQSKEAVQRGGATAKAAARTAARVAGAEAETAAAHAETVDDSAAACAAWTTARVAEAAAWSTTRAAARAASRAAGVGGGCRIFAFLLDQIETQIGGM